MKQIILFSLVLLVCNPIFGQPASFSYILEGDTERDPEFSGMVQGESGEVYTFGRSWADFGSFSPTAPVIVCKWDSTGDISWVKEYDFTRAYNVSGAYSDHDSSLVISLTVEYDSLYSCFLKIDSEGVLKWEKLFKHTEGNLDMNSVTVLADSGILLTGFTRDSIGNSRFRPFITKTDHQGNPQWTRKFGGTNTDFQRHCLGAEAADGNILFAMSCVDTISHFPVVYKLDFQGNTIWEQSYREDTAFMMRPLVIQPTRDSGLVLAGSARPTTDHDYFPFVMKLDSSGNVEWWNYYKWDSILDTWANEIIELANGDFLVNVTGTKDDYLDANLLHLAPDGNVRRAKELGVDDNFILTALQETASGIILGSGWIRRQTTWSRTYGVILKLMPFADLYCDETPQNWQAFSCFRRSGTMPYDIPLTNISFSRVNNGVTGILTKVLHCEESVGISPQEAEHTFELFPNPATHLVHVKTAAPSAESQQLELYDLAGQKICTLNLASRWEEVQIPVGELPAGLYFLSVKESDKLLYTEKLIISR